MYLYSAEGIIFTIISAVLLIVKIALPILAIVFLIKAIKYMSRKDRRESYTAYQREKTTLDDIERDLNNHKD